MAQAHDGEGHRQLGHGQGVHPEGVAEHDAALLHRLQVHGVVAGPELADDLQVGQGVNHPLGQEVQPDDGRITVAEEGDHLVFGQAARKVVELGVGIELEQLALALFRHPAGDHRHAQAAD